MGLTSVAVIKTASVPPALVDALFILLDSTSYMPLMLTMPTDAALIFEMKKVPKATLLKSAAEVPELNV